MSGRVFEKDTYLRLFRERAEINRQLKEANGSVIAELEDLLVPRIGEIEEELARTAPTSWEGRAAAVALLAYELEEHYFQGRTDFQVRFYRALLAGIREGLPAAPDWLCQDLVGFSNWKMCSEEPESAA